MKKIIRILMLLSIVSLFAVTNTKAQEIVVGVRPVHPRLIRRTFRPSPRHVWVSEEWTPVGGTYVYHAGYWALPATSRDNMGGRSLEAPPIAGISG